MIYFQDILFNSVSEGLQWFRDNHNIYGQIELDMTSYPKFAYSIYKYENHEFKNITGENRHYSDLYRSYPEAEYYCLMKIFEIYDEIFS